LQIFFLLTSVFIVFNLERTLRSSTGRIRWQIKFMALGVGGLFALRIYVATQALLFSRIDTGLGTTSSVALLAANLLFAVSLSRARSLNTDVYLSRATIQNSLTIILAGTYLVAVGVAANLARSLFPGQPLPLDAFIVFLALTGLAILIFSNRLRQELRRFVTRNFRRPIYDYRGVWMDLTQRTASLLEINELSAAISKIVSECLEILSVNVWLIDETQQNFKLVGSTALSGVQARELENAGRSAPDFIRFLRHERAPIDLEEKKFEWPDQIMRTAPDFFRDSKMRYAIRLHAGGELVGVMTLNDDRVGHETLSGEDLVLLETLAAQLAASLLNLKLSGRLREAGKVEAFQTVSTFFVHDLKNLASRLSLTMQNLPQHFDDPEFRADALRVISASLAKIDGMCSRLTMLRQNVELRVAECDLNQLVTATLDEFNTDLRASLERKLQPIPRTLIDQEQIHKVLTNLVINANEAVNGNGLIQVMTFHEGSTVSFAVTDNGCGMSSEFIEKSLFRPFQTTKKKGLGIGLFQSKLIIEAHRGKIEVNSTPGKGTEFRVVLPVA
jgi:putative PEP-CTERM system histidine kinase